MSKRYSIYCPHSDHENYKTKLIILGSDYLRVYCRLHGWVQFSFSRFGETLNFEKIAVQAKFLPKKTHIDTIEMPIMALGGVIGH